MSDRVNFCHSQHLFGLISIAFVPFINRDRNNAIERDSLASLLQYKRPRIGKKEVRSVKCQLHESIRCPYAEHANKTKPTPRLTHLIKSHFISSLDSSRLASINRGHFKTIFIISSFKIRFFPTMRVESKQKEPCKLSVCPRRHFMEMFFVVCERRKRQKCELRILISIKT